MFKQVHHIGFAVYDLDTTISLMKETYRITPDSVTDISSREMRAALFNVGETFLEYLAPTSEESSFFKYLKERGEGFHHIAYLVENIREAKMALPVDAIIKERRSDVGDWLIADLNPKYFFGLTSQIVESK